jgi:hypothetical protein
MHGRLDERQIAGVYRHFGHNILIVIDLEARIIIMTSIFHSLNPGLALRRLVDVTLRVYSTVKINMLREGASKGAINLYTTKKVSLSGLAVRRAQFFNP